MTGAEILLHRLLPFLRWWPMVTRETVRADLLAGLVGAIVVLPQGVAFATLAGLPPQYGLYCAMVPTVVAAFFGSSWHAVTGPTNAVSLIVFATLAPLAVPGSAEYIGFALTLSFMCGLIMLAMGFARLGALVNFISHTVVVGFTAGAATLIIASQLASFLGLDIARSSVFLRTVRDVVAHLPEVNPYVALVALATLAAGLLARRFVPKVPYMILAMVAGSILAFALNASLGAERTGIRTLGALPGALPALSRPEFSLDTMQKLLGIAVAVTVLGLTEAVSIARAIALKTGQRIDASQEFIGQGLANVAASFFSGYPSTASFNRSGVNYEAGARTPLAAAAAAGFLVVALFAVAPLLAYLPIASMAAVLFLVAWGLFDFASMRTILRTSRAETAVLAVTFGATLLMALEMAIVAGMVLSLVLYLHRTSQPRVVSIVPDPGAESRKFTEAREGRPECPQLRMVRIEGSIYFGAVNHVDGYLEWLRDARPDQKHVVLMAKGVRFVDVAGAELLAHEARRRRAEGGGLYLHGLRHEAERLLRKPPFIDAIGADNIFATKDQAIRTIFERLDRDVCRRCTARIFLECAALPPPVHAAAPAASAEAHR